MKNEEGIWVKNRELKRMKVMERVIEKRIKLKRGRNTLKAVGQTNRAARGTIQKGGFEGFNPQAARKRIQPET